MIPFKDIELQDKELITSFTLNSPRRNCDLSFSNLCSWRFLYNTKFAIMDGFLLLKFWADGELVYMMPIGNGDLNKVLDALIEDANREGEPFCLLGICAGMCSELETFMPGRFQFTADRDCDAEGFNIFELSTNDKGEPMLKHAPLGDASPVEVREAQCVSGPLAVLDDYYGVYVTCPDDAQYRLDWIKEIYTPDMNNDYVYPNVFMSNEDTEQVSNLQADLQTYMNTQKANWIMNGTTDAEWNEYLSKLEDYGLSDYLGIMQKYLDAYYA